MQSEKKPYKYFLIFFLSLYEKEKGGKKSPGATVRLHKGALIHSQHHLSPNYPRSVVIVIHNQAPAKSSRVGSTTELLSWPEVAR